MVTRFLSLKFAATVLFMGLFAGHAVAQQTMKIGLSTINDGQHEFAKLFADQMEKLAPGKLKIEIYPGEQLGSAPRLIEGLSLGTVQGWTGPAEFLAGQDPRYQVTAAPGILANLDHANRLLKDPEFRKALLSFGDAKGIKGIGAVSGAGYYYASRKPIRNFADFKGMKIRVIGSPMHTLAMEKIGATGIPMNPADALVALGSGAIDANRTAMSLLVNFKYFDVVKFVTKADGDALIVSLLAVSKNWFERLPADVQKAVLESAASVEERVYKFAAEQQTSAEAAWQASAAQLFAITGSDQAEFAKRLATVGEEVVARNPRIKDAYALMRDRANATR